MEPVSPPVEPTSKLSLPFAARFQGMLIAVMLIGLVMIAQRQSLTLFRIGLPLLIIAAFLQIAFGNIPPRSGFARSMALLVVTWVIVAAIFFVSVKLAPTLIEASR
jgi:hypothetical protein